MSTDFSHCTADGGGASCPPDWYVRQGFSVLTRSRPRRLELSWDLSLGEITQKMSNRSLGFDVAPGLQFTIGRYLGRDRENRDYSVEFCYEGLHQWDEHKEVRPALPGNLVSPFYVYAPEVNIQIAVPGFDFADRHYATHVSEMHNFEMNAWMRPRGRPDKLVLYPNGRWRRERQWGPHMGYMVGFQALTLDESSSFYGFGTIGLTDEDDNLVGTSATMGEYSVRTRNDMLGIHVGANMLFRGNRWEYGVVAKAGPMLNFSGQSTRILTEGGANATNIFIGDLDVSREVNQSATSLYGELNVTGSWRLTRHLLARADYTFFWVTGMALAPEQYKFQLNPPPILNDNGHIYGHGLALALEWEW